MIVDDWATDLFTPSYNGIELASAGVALVSTADNIGRDTVVTVYPRRSGGHVDDQGQVPRETRWEVLFYADPAASASHVSRFQSFVAELQRGETGRLVHPLTGEFDVRVGSVNFDGNATDRNQISLSVTFIEHNTEPAPFELPEGGALDSSREQVQEAVDAVYVEAVAAGLDEPTVAAQVEALADSWATGDASLTASAVTLQLNKAANEIETYASAINVATDLSRQPMLVAITRMRDALNKMAEAVIYALPRITTTTLRVTTPLMQFCAERYGGALAAQRYGEILELNRIADVLQVPSGRTLFVPEV